MATILLCDDHAPSRKALASLLDQEGHRVLQSANGEEALVLARAQRPDLVISDILMPRMDGFEFVRLLRGEPAIAKTPVIFLSGNYVDDAAGELSVKCGVYKLLSKSSSPEEILITIERALSPDGLSPASPVAAATDDVVGGHLRLVTDKLSQKLAELEEANAALEQEVAVRRRAEEGLRETSEALTGLIHASPVAIVTVDRATLVLTWNPAAERLLGASQEEAVGRPLATFGDGRKAEMDELFARILSGAGFSDHETVQRRVDGSAVDVSLSGAPLFDAHGAVTRAVLVFMDISPRKRAEEALREKEEQLRQSQKMDAIGKLAGGVAHDFNNQLTVVMGHAETVLGRMAAADESRRSVEMILRASQQAASITRQLLVFSRRKVVQPQVLDLNAVVGDVVKMLRAVLGVHLSWNVALDTDPVRVQMDPGQVEQVIMNLIVNARDAMPRGGTITLRTRHAAVPEDDVPLHAGARPGPHVVLEVADTGCGMDAATRQRIFEPFFTTKPVGKGTGLGLATSFGIVSQAGGHFRVSSTVGEGTSFAVFLPAARASASAAMPDTRGVARRPTGETVLVVEDDPSVRAIVCSFLTLDGYRVLESASGTEALAIAQKHGPGIDLLLTDLLMPGMTGRELLATLAPDRPQMRYLFMSGYTAESPAAEADLAGALLEKPFTRAALLSRVREALDAKPAVATPLPTR